MPRPHRKFSNSKIYHIILKGIDNQNIFYDNEDREVFLENMLITKKKFDYKLYAYCLMGNHVHLVMGVKNDFLSKSIQSLTVRYVYYFNKKYDREGPFVRNRFKSKNIENQKYFLDVCRYVHRNPEKAGIEKTQKYKWSSYHEYIGKEKVIDRRVLLHYLNNDIDEFIKYTTKSDNSEELLNMADFELINRLSDEEFMGIIIKKFKLKCIEDIIPFFKKEREEKRIDKIKELQKIQGSNKNQIARITRISRGTLVKIWNKK